MSAASNGGQAFPVPLAADNVGGVLQGYDGMTLHDYFAAHAPITTNDAMLACGITAHSVGMLLKSQRIAVMTALAEMRAEYADAMLERRAQ